MNEGPTGPTPEETPPAPEPTPAHQPASWEVPAHTPPPAAAEPAPYVPPPDYAAPPGYGAPVVAPRRSRGPVLVAVIVVVVLIVAIIGYVAAGFAVAAGQISSADKTLNSVITNENAITAQFNKANGVTLLDLKTATSAELAQNKTTAGQVATQSGAAQPTITSDDAALVTADASLKENSWLTALSRSNLDQKSAKIGHWRNALASAKTVTGDLVQLGTFVQSYDDSLTDFVTLDAKLTANSNDFTGIAASLGTLKTDVAKAIPLAGAPGLSPDMKAFLTDLQAFAADFQKLLNDAIAGSDLTADEAQFSADANKVDAHDIVAMNTAITAFYTPLIDAYNSEVAKANAM